MDLGHPNKPLSAEELLADTRTRLAYERTFLACDRSLMAWVRTALAMISFGFAIYKFFQYSIEPGHPIDQFTPYGHRIIGIVLVGLGAVLQTASLIEFSIHTRELRREVDGKFPFSTAFFTGIFLSILGTLIFFYLLGELSDFYTTNTMGS